MSNKPFNLKSISLKIKTDRPVRKTPYQVKGILMKQSPDSEIVPMLNGSYRKKYLYPRIQVKILNEQIIIFAINEGVKPLLKIQDSITLSLLVKHGMNYFQEVGKLLLINSSNHDESKSVKWEYLKESTL